MAFYNQNSPPGMLSISEAIEQDRWIPDNEGGMIEFIQEPQLAVPIEDEAPQFMNWYDLSDAEKASGKYKVPEEELARLSEIVAAGKAFWDAAKQGAMDFLGGDGMLSGTIKQLASEISNDSGRRKPVEIKNLRGQKPGWKIAEGSNFWSVDETDPYWKTEEGYNEGVDLYGMKPSFIKAKDVATLVYNPTTGEYDSTKKEEFVNLQPTKRISL